MLGAFRPEASRVQCYGMPVGRNAGGGARATRPTAESREPIQAPRATGTGAVLSPTPIARSRLV